MSLSTPSFRDAVPKRRLRVAALCFAALLSVACGGGGGSSSASGSPQASESPEGEASLADERVRVGRIRHVDPDRAIDPDAWGEGLDRDLEAEFWDIIGNSAHDVFDDWRGKVLSYTRRYEDHSPRMDLLLAAGGVFQLSEPFGKPLLGGVGVLGDLQYINDAIVRMGRAIPELQSGEAAVTFFHNNRAMLNLLVGAGASNRSGLCHLEQLRILETLNPDFLGTEGRAAAPFTYGMVARPEYLDYAIDMSEDCDTDICMWTSKLAPYKPIGELMMLGELHWIRSVTTNDPTVKEQSRDKFEEMFARAENLGRIRDYPYLDRIGRIKTEIESRSEYGRHPLLVQARYPMPVYSNGTNCSNCHIGGKPTGTGEPLDNPYPNHDLRTPIPDPPDFLPPGFDLQDCALDHDTGESGEAS